MVVIEVTEVSHPLWRFQEFVINHDIDVGENSDNHCKDKSQLHEIHFWVFVVLECSLRLIDEATL